MKRLQERWTTEEFEELEELAHLVGDGYGLLDNGDRTISVYKDTDYSYGDQPDRERDNLPTFKTIGECAEYLNNILLDDDEDSFDESLNNQKEDTKNMKEVLKNNKLLKEESNIDKINRYLVSIGEAPLTEATEDEKIKVSGLDAYRVQRAISQVNDALKQLDSRGLTIGKDFSVGINNLGHLVPTVEKRFANDDRVMYIFNQLKDGCNFFNILRLKKDKDFTFEKGDDGIYVLKVLKALGESKEDANPYDKLMTTVQKRGVKKSDDTPAKSSKPTKFKSDDTPYDKLKKHFKSKAGVDLDECDEPMKECKKPVTESVKKTSAAKVGRPGNLMESMNRGFVKLYGDFDDSKSLVESKGNKKKSLKENYEKQSDRLSSFLASSGKGNLLLKGDEEEYGKPHLSSIVLDAAKKKGYKVFDLGRMDLTKDYEEQGFNSPKTLLFVDGYIPRKNASSILALLDDSEFKGKIVVIEYPDRPLDIAVKRRLGK